MTDEQHEEIIDELKDILSIKNKKSFDELVSLLYDYIVKREESNCENCDPMDNFEPDRNPNG